MGQCVSASAGSAPSPQQQQQQLAKYQVQDDDNTKPKSAASAQQPAETTRKSVQADLVGPAPIVHEYRAAQARFICMTLFNTSPI